MSTSLANDSVSGVADLVDDQTSQPAAADPIQDDQKNIPEARVNNQVKPDKPVIPTAPADQKEVIGSMLKEAEPRVYEKKEFEVAPEVKSWVKLEKKEEIVLPHPIKDEYGQILIESAQPAKLKITLPLSQSQLHQAVKQKLVESVRWMAQWCLRLIKMFPKRVNYGSNN